MLIHHPDVGLDSLAQVSVWVIPSAEGSILGPHLKVRGSGTCTWVIIKDFFPQVRVLLGIVNIVQMEITTIECYNMDKFHDLSAMLPEEKEKKLSL